MHITKIKKTKNKKRKQTDLASRIIEEWPYLTGKPLNKKGRPQSKKKRKQDKCAWRKI